MLFAHWRVAEDALRRHVPQQLPLDTFEASSWVGITPFRISGLRVRGLPPVPVLSSFLEINVRTYVTVDGRPGIFFLSLDAGSPLAVEAARLVYGLPYFRARMSVERTGDWIDYASTRTDGRGHRAVFRAGYRPVGDPQPPAPGAREHFLTERYCLYTVEDGTVRRAEVHHPPWPLQAAEAELEENTMPPAGLVLAGAPLLHYSERQDVVIWRPERL